MWLLAWARRQVYPRLTYVTVSTIWFYVALTLFSDGKNVCLYFLFGTCKFGPTKCAYSHRRDWLPSGWWDSDEGVQGELQRREDEKRTAKEARRAAVAAEKEARQQRKREQQHLNTLLHNLTNGAPRAATPNGLPVNGLNGTMHHVNGASGHNIAHGGNSSRKPQRKPRIEPRPSPAPPPQPGMYPALFHAPRQPSLNLQDIAEHMQAMRLVELERQARRAQQQHGFTDRQVLELAAYGIKPWDEGAAVRRQPVALE
jgi:hypothetical protein